jgi:hypothetical protein
MAELRQADKAQPETKAKTRTKTRTRPAHRRPVLVTGAVLAAAAIAGAAVVGTNAHSIPPAQAPVTAAQLLDKIADAAASQQTPAVKDSEFTYIRSEVAYTTYTMSPHHVTSTMATLHERQVWLPVANLCVTGLLIENGDRTLLSPFPVVHGKVDRNEPKGLVPNFTCPSEGNLGDSTYRLLESLPTQPDALLAYLKAGQQSTNEDPPSEIGNLIREAIVPPRLAAALYRLAATLPGATLVPHATNATGQPGIGIMWTGKSAQQIYKNEWIFDKNTLQFTGERTYDPKTGQLTGESAILQRGFAAQAGQQP